MKAEAPSALRPWPWAIPAGGSCTVSGSQASCSLGTLPSGAARTITLSLTGNAIGTETLTADVMAIDDFAVANDTASV